MQILKALNWRYAVKRFNQEKISPALLAQLLEATRLSTSAYGLQAYKLLSIESKSLGQGLLAHFYGHPDDKQASKPKVQVDNSQFLIEFKEPSDDELVAVGF